MTDREESTDRGETDLFEEELRRLARRLSSDPLAADDLLQDAWLASRRSSAGAVSNRKSWFATVLVNLARMRRRSESRRAEHERRASRPEGAESAAENDGEALAQLRASVAALRDPYREVVLLHYFEALSFPEIAERVGRSEGTLRSQHKRALEILRGSRRSRAQAIVALLERFVRHRKKARRAAAAAAESSLLLRWLLPSVALVAVAVVVLGPLRTSSPEPVDLAFEPDRALVRDPTPVDEAESIGRRESDDRTPETVRSTRPAAEPADDRGSAVVPASARTIRVAVRDASGGPIPLAQVSLRSPSEDVAHTWTTDADGRVEIPIDLATTTCDAGSERIQLSAFADGWSTRFETIVAIDGDSTPAVELALEGVEMRLVGRVTDTRGQPIAGVTVAAIPARSEMIGAGNGNLLRPLRHSAITRADGRFTIAWIPRERRRLQVLRQGFVVHESTIEPARASDEIVVRLEDPALLSGTVRHADGRPAAAASVFWERYSQPPANAIQTEADGRFRFEGIPPGWLRVWATLPGPSYETATDVVLLEPGREHGWEAELAPRAPLVVRLVNRHGAPVACARVEFVRWAQSDEMPHRTAEEHLRAFDTWTRTRLTDDQGRVVVHPAPDRPIEARIFVAALSSALPAFVERGLVPGTGEHEVRLDPSESPGSLSGWIDDADGRPLTEAMIALGDQKTLSLMYVPVDPTSGFFHVDGLPPSTFEIDVSVSGRGGLALGTIEVASGQACDVGRIATPSRARLTIRWSWPEDRSASRSFSLCQQTHRNGVQVPISVDVGDIPPASGWELFPGIYSLHVNESGRLRQFRVFSLPPGSSIEVESGPEERFLWPVRVTSDPNDPLADARVVVRRTGESEPCAEHLLPTGPDGAAAGYVSLTPGAYEIEARSSDGRRGEGMLQVSEDDLIRTFEIVLR